MSSLTRQRRGSRRPRMGVEGLLFILTDGTTPAARGQACPKPFVQRTASLPFIPDVASRVGAGRSANRGYKLAPSGLVETGWNPQTAERLLTTLNTDYSSRSVFFPPDGRTGESSPGAEGSPTSSAY